MRMKEWQETSINSAKPAAEQSTRTSVEVFLAGPGNGVEQEIEPAPFLPDCREKRLELARRANVAGEEDFRIDLARERLDIGFGLVVEVGHGKLGTSAPEVLRRRPGKAVLVGDANDKPLAAGQIQDFHNTLLL